MREFAVAKKRERMRDAEIVRPYAFQMAVSIWQARRRRNLTQRQLASSANVPQSSVAGIESGWGNVTLRNLIKVASILEISLEDIFRDSRGYINIWAEENFLKQNIWPKGWSISEKILSYEEIFKIDFDISRQAVIWVKSGEIHVKAEYMRAVHMIKEKHVVLVPGGGELKIFGTSSIPAQILIVESPRPEGRPKVTDEVHSNSLFL